MTDLTTLGWNESFARAFTAFAASGLIPGRVVGEDRGMYDVITEDGEYRAEVSGRLLYITENPTDLPKVGDWVALVLFPDERKAIVQGVLPRASKFSRKVAGKLLDEQILAANIDVLFVVQGLDGNVNLPRLERYLTMAREGGVRPIVVLNKSDVCEDLDATLNNVRAAAGDAEIVAVSALTGEIEALRRFLRPGQTFALVGSSGVGKSTIINSLAAADLQATYEVNEKGHKGRHTTTRRELITLADGTMLVDTPGMRELQLWGTEDSLNEAFDDIEALATDCRFSDCTHTHEDHCAVRAALEDGTLSETRYTAYLKLQRELNVLEAKQEKNSYLERKARGKALAKAIRRMQQTRPKDKGQ